MAYKNPDFLRMVLPATPVQTVVMRQNEARDDFDEDAIRKIAYGLWELRGAPIGSPDVDWVEAERQLCEGAPEDAGFGR
jgi:hypothetical protein